MFLRKLAFAVNRLDFWNLPKELTATQLAVHRAAMELDPIGEARSDQRAAVQAIVITQANLAKQMTPDQVQEIWKAITGYTPLHNTESPKRVSADEAAKQGKAAFASVGIK